MKSSKSDTGGNEEHNDHKHEIETLSFSIPGEFEPEKFRAWMEGFIRNYAGDLFRSKGIASLRGVPERMVFQEVHGIFRLTLGQPWNDAERLTQAVFIGSNLQKDEIQSGLEACRA